MIPLCLIRRPPPRMDLWLVQRHEGFRSRLSRLRSLSGVPFGLPPHHGNANRSPLPLPLPQVVVLAHGPPPPRLTLPTPTISLSPQSTNPLPQCLSLRMKRRYRLSRGLWISLYQHCVDGRSPVCRANGIGRDNPIYPPLVFPSALRAWYSMLNVPLTTLSRLLMSSLGYFTPLCDTPSLADLLSRTTILCKRYRSSLCSCPSQPADNAAQSLASVRLLISLS